MRNWTSILGVHGLCHAVGFAGGEGGGEFIIQGGRVPPLPLGSTTDLEFSESVKIHISAYNN